MNSQLPGDRCGRAVKPQWQQKYKGRRLLAESRRTAGSIRIGRYGIFLLPEAPQMMTTPKRSTTDSSPTPDRPFAIGRLGQRSKSREDSPQAKSTAATPRGGGIGGNVGLDEDF
jgi:hypothetical protein